MSLSLGAYRIQFLIQNIIPMPYKVNLEYYILVGNKDYQTHFHKIFRCCVLISFVFVAMPLIIYRLLWLFFHWKSFTMHNVDQLVIHIFGLGAASIFLPACYTINIHNIELQYLINQRCKIVPVVSKVSSRFIIVPLFGKISIMELPIYGLSSIFIMLVLGITALPFAVSYEPIQWIVGSTTTLTKLIATFIYFIHLIYTVPFIFSILLLNIIVLEGIVSYSSTLLFYKSLCTSLTRVKFRVGYKRYRILQIILLLMDSILEEFFTLLIFLGVLAASSAAYMSLKMYSKLNIFMFLLGPASTLLSVALALLLTYLSNFPYRNTKTFQIHSKQFVMTKESRRVLRSCSHIGIRLGPYGIANSILGVYILDDIIRNTVTLLLLGKI